MADIKQGAAAAAPAAAQAPAKKRPPTKLIILVAGTLLLVGGGAGAFMYLNHKPEASPEAAKKAETRKLPTFVDLDPFTVNLAEKDQDRYMQIKFSLEVAPNEAEATIKDMMPALRSEILLVLGSRQASDLGSRDGKEALARDIVNAANKSLEHTSAERAVSAVRITQLIIQ
ncbi:MAG TPA: flagellar basal body-associated FliL family protein [Burkholderiaceae bacterium]|jgi:flagellar FliL protein|nr:flagellar basal body-associated FliL family protein [Burkholderiaceae bacterium]